MSLSSQSTPNKEPFKEFFEKLEKGELKIAQQIIFDTDSKIAMPDEVSKDWSLFFLIKWLMDRKVLENKDETEIYTTETTYEENVAFINRVIENSNINKKFPFAYSNINVSNFSADVSNDSNLNYLEIAIKENLSVKLIARILKHNGLDNSIFDEKHLTLDSNEKKKYSLLEYALKQENYELAKLILAYQVHFLGKDIDGIQKNLKGSKFKAAINTAIKKSKSKSLARLYEGNNKFEDIKEQLIEELKTIYEKKLFDPNIKKFAEREKEVKKANSPVMISSTKNTNSKVSKEERERVGGELYSAFYEALNSLAPNEIKEKAHLNKDGNGLYIENDTRVKDTNNNPICSNLPDLGLRSSDNSVTVKKVFLKEEYFNSFNEINKNETKKSIFANVFAGILSKRINSETNVGKIVQLDYELEAIMQTALKIVDEHFDPLVPLFPDQLFTLGQEVGNPELVGYCEKAIPSVPNTNITLTADQIKELTLQAVDKVVKDKVNLMIALISQDIEIINQLENSSNDISNEDIKTMVEKESTEEQKGDNHESAEKLEEPYTSPTIFEDDKITSKKVGFRGTVKVKSVGGTERDSKLNDNKTEVKKVSEPQLSVSDTPSLQSNNNNNQAYSPASSQRQPATQPSTASGKMPASHKRQATGIPSPASIKEPNASIPKQPHKIPSLAPKKGTKKGAGRDDDRRRQVQNPDADLNERNKQKSSSSFRKYIFGALGLIAITALLFPGAYKKLFQEVTKGVNRMNYNPWVAYGNSLVIRARAKVNELASKVTGRNV
ncbi:MAG: hypothetical protein J0H68_04095 [Sphingobacteriia bacterium]|nr:hypothetical protein [Sphingobacteriia bacterium]